MGASCDTGVSQDRKSAAGCWANMSIHRSGVLTALEEEPASFLSLVNPVLQQACGSHVSCLVAKRMNLAHVSRQYCVVFAEFSYHIERLNVFSIAVHDALKARNLPDRTNGCPADLPYALGNGVRHGEKLVALVIEHQVIVAEIRASHVPMKVLGLEI